MRKISIFLFIFVFAVGAFGQQKGAKTVAENFNAVSLDGQVVDLENLKGKVVVMTFWSTRCAICHSEIPKLNRVADQYKGKDVVFLGLTMENPTKVENFLKTNPFNFNILPNSFGVLLKYAPKDSKGNLNMGFPAHFVINQRGEIEYRAMGYDKTQPLSNQISRLLASE